MLSRISSKMSSTTPYALQNNRIHVVNPPEALNKLADKRKETRGNGSYPKYNFKYNGGASTITPIPRPWHRQHKISHPAVHRQCIFPSRHPSTSRPAPAPQSGLRTSHIAHRTTPVATCVSCQSSVNRVRARRNREIEGHHKRADYPLAPSESFYAKGCRLAGCPRSTLRRSLSWNRFVEAHSFVIATGHCRNEQSTTDGLLIDQLVHCKQASVRKLSGPCHPRYSGEARHSLVRGGWITNGDHWGHSTIEDIVWLPCYVSLDSS